MDNYVNALTKNQFAILAAVLAAILTGVLVKMFMKHQKEMFSDFKPIEKKDISECEHCPDCGGLKLEK
jgi:hypothetical protein